MSRIKKKKNEVCHVSIEAGQAGRRIDNYLSSRFKGLPRSRIYQMLRRGEVRINGGRVKPDYRLQQGDSLRLPPVTLDAAPEKKAPPPRLFALAGESIVYEDKELLAINKPSGIAVHGGSGLDYGLIDILRHIYKNNPDLQLIHRLDRETSGLLLLAKNPACLRKIHEQLRSNRVKKVYQALLVGNLDSPLIVVDAPLEKNIKQSGERMVSVTPSGKAAHTRFELQKNYPGVCLVRVEPGTGRTHQIRVHAKAMGHPVAGDSKYGDREVNKKLRQRGLKRLFLHASRLELPEYRGKNPLIIEAPLPDDLSRFLDNYGASPD